MCILSVYRPNVPVSVDELRRGAQCNSDGHGFAIIIDGRIVTGHSLDDPNTLINEFAALRAEYPGTYAIFHSRITTHGNTTLDNCHPFVVDGDGGTVLAHNGILPALAQPKPGDRRSDTRILAEDVFMSRWGKKLDRAKTRSAFEAWIGGYNKVVILTVNPRYKHNLYLFNERAGTMTPEGVWHSNTSFKGYRPASCGTGWSWNASTNRATYTDTRPHRASVEGSYVWDTVLEAWEFIPADDTARYVQWWDDAEGRAPSFPVKPVTIGYAGKFLKAVCPSCLVVDIVSKVDLICNGCSQCFVCYEDVRDCECGYVTTSDIRRRLQGLDDARGLTIEQTISARLAIREYADDLAYAEFSERTGYVHGGMVTESEAMGDDGTFRDVVDMTREDVRAALRELGYQPKDGDEDADFWESDDTDRLALDCDE